MEVQKILVLRGPNTWGRVPVVEAWIDLGPLAGLAIHQLPGLEERLTSRLPDLVEHGGSLRRLRQGASLAHVLGLVALGLQNLAGAAVGFGRTCETSRSGVYRIAFEYEHEGLGHAALAVAREFCLAAVTGRPFDARAEVAKLRELARRLRPVPLAAAVMRAARRRGVPVRSLADEGLLLGQGARQRRVLVETDAVPEGPAAEAAGDALVAGLFADGNGGRIPAVAVTGVNGKTTTTRLIAHALTLDGRRVGMTCTEGIYVVGARLEAGDCSGPKSARTILSHPDVEAAVLETARGGILREGLGFDLCDVAVVTNVGEGDHLGCGGVETVEQLARVKRVVVEAVRPGGAAVLNAADPLVADMARHCRGALIFFARDPEHPVLAAHRAAGGKAAFVRGGRVVLAEGGREAPVASLRRVPLTGGGRVGFQVENVLAATAAAWSLGVGLRAIRAALRSFAADVEHAPARFNLLEVNGAVAVLDYGHNPSSLAAILETLAQFPPGRRTAVYSAAGDRRDADLLRQGELLGDAFDRVILYEDGNVARGRERGEIIGLFRQGLANRSRVAEVQEIEGAVRAVDLALSSARPGELLLVQVDAVEETLELVRGYLAGGAAREIGWEAALSGLSAACPTG